MHRRVACIALPDIRLEIALETERPGKTCALEASARAPCAVVIARAGGAVKTERDVLGATKLDVVSREAHAYGVRAGQTVAAARARCSELRVRVVPEDEVKSELERVTEAALAFGPTAAFDMSSDVIWVEVGGCANLHGGERELAAALDARVRALGHACRVAIADGPRIASAVARWGPSTRSLCRTGGCLPMLVAEGGNASALRDLPLEALGLDPDTVAWLEDLGLRTCGALQKLPRKSLGTRLGSRTHEVMQLLDGEDRAPLPAWQPPEVPEERAALEWGASSVEALGFVVKALSEKLALRLESRAMAASRLELVLDLDRALCERPASVVAVEPRCTFGLELPVPVVRAADLFAVIRARLEHETLPAPVLTVTLRVPKLASAEGRTLDWLAPEPRADRALPRLVAEIAAELGSEHVGTLELVDTWHPARRTQLVPFGGAREVRRRLRVMSALEPTRLVKARRIPSSALEHPELLARIEGVEWWRRGVVDERAAGSSDSTRRGDWLVAWLSSSSEPGRRARAGLRAMAWVERVSIRSSRRPPMVQSPRAVADAVGGVPGEQSGQAKASGQESPGEAESITTLRGWLD